MTNADNYETEQDESELNPICDPMYETDVEEFQRYVDRMIDASSTFLLSWFKGCTIAEVLDLIATCEEEWPPTRIDDLQTELQKLKQEHPQHQH